MSNLARIKIDATDVPQAKVEIDGADVSNNVRAIQYTHVAGQLPQVTIEVLSRPSIDGLALVELVSPQDDRDSLLEWLSRLDGAQLDNEVLSRMNWSDDKCNGDVVLEVLREWAGAVRSA